MSENARAESVKEPAAASSPGFFEEASDIWRRLPHKSLFFLLLGGWIVLFHYFGNATMGYTQTSSMFLWAHSVYIGPDDDQHGDYIPFVFLALLWIRRDDLKCKARLWWPALLYFLAAILCQVVAFRIQQGRVSVLAFILGLHALIGLAWGPDALRKSIFPVFFLLFCIPMGAISGIITSALRVFVTQVCVGFTHNLLGIQVFREGAQIFGARHEPLYEVAPACSGMRSLVALGALSVIYAFLNFTSPWRRLVIIACSAPFAVIGNIFRVTTVIIVGDSFGKEAGAMIENKFGFFTFAVAIGLMMAVGFLLRERSPGEKEKKAPPPPAPMSPGGWQPEEAV